MKRRLFQLSLLILVFTSLRSHAQGTLEQYIKIGLDSNLALRQKNFDLQKSRLDLKRAEALFFPQVSFNADYTLANGGRKQDIPIGDLLNNVYSTLNQLTASNKFPQVANQNIQFLPNNYHDTRIQVSLPVVNTDIHYNRAIKGDLVKAQQAEVDIYKRELVKNIKTAYFQYLQAEKAVNIYSNALSLTHENLRVSEKLVQNAVATQEVILRAR